MRRFLLLVIVVAIGGGVLYSFNSLVRDQANSLWANWFPQDSVAAAPVVVPAIAKKKKAADQWENPFEKIDAFAVKTPESKTKDIATLAAYLVKPAKTESEKVRAIFRWTAENISYDDVSYNSGGYGATEAEDVLKSRTSVCQGYAVLMKALCVEAGLEAEVVGGYSKGFGFAAGKKFTKSDHAWNAVKINGQWQLFDATWAAGFGESKNGKLVSTKKYDDYWYDVDPYEMIFSHLPEDSTFQLIDRPLSLADYERLPYVSGQFFAAGFDGRRVFDKAVSGEVKNFVTTFDLPGRVLVEKAPFQAELTAGEKVLFQFTSPDFVEMALVNDGDWIHAKAKNGVMRATIVPKVGDLRVMFLPKGSKSGSYSGLLEYDVRLRKGSTLKRPA